MGASFDVKTPHAKKVTLPDGSATLTFRPDFGARISDNFNDAQKFVDNEVLRLSEPLIPFRSGYLVRSGKVGTVLGNGEVIYNAPYARFQYYRTAQTRDYDIRRGGMWFERMKAAHRDEILKAAKRMVKNG